MQTGGFSGARVVDNNASSCTIGHMGQYDRVIFEDDKKVTRRQRQALRHVSEMTVNRFNLAIHCYQGSWRPKTTYSGTTHMGAGVCDLYVYGMSSMSGDDLGEITRLLRREGCQAAQLRGPWDNMPFHWHVCDLDTRGMDPNAIWQVGQYRAPGGPYNGLDAGVPSHNSYRPRPIKEWKYQDGRRN